MADVQKNVNRVDLAAKMYDPEIAMTFFSNVIGKKMGNKGPALNQSILQSLIIMDEQDAINSGHWYNLPRGLSQNLIERILYYRASGIFFYMESNDTFYFLPYVGKGIDVYGRYLTATPLPFNGTVEADKGKGGRAKPWIDGLDLKIAHDFIPSADLFEDGGLEIFTKSAVILNDYTIQLPQKPVPRSILQMPYLTVMAEIIPFTRTALLNGTGVDGIRIQSADEAPNVALASNSIIEAAINGERWIPLVGGLQTEELGHETPTKIEDYLVALQSLDNIRLSFHGIENGGIFEKKAHMLQSEQNMISGTAGLVLQDKTFQRQNFCNIVNSIWGLGIWWEPSEPAIEGDLNGDGIVGDNYSDDMSGNKEV